MHTLLFLSGTLLAAAIAGQAMAQKVFDTHLHGSPDAPKQVQALQEAGVYKAAVSTSWNLQNTYQDKAGISFLRGLMVPCPNGKVPYSQQACYPTGKDWPEAAWVEQQIRDGKVDFLGEVLSQYYGISASDTAMFPYYALAERYGLPVGIHTGLAGPNHGGQNFRVALGNPLLLEPLLVRFPRLRVWIMHAGTPYLQETIALMSYYRNVHADISVLCNPDITSPAQFASSMRALLDAGLENQLMFGSDNGDIRKTMAAVKALRFLSDAQREKLFNQNAERFFAKSQAEPRR